MICGGGILCDDDCNRDDVLIMLLNKFLRLLHISLLLLGIVSVYSMLSSSSSSS